MRPTRVVVGLCLGLSVGLATRPAMAGQPTTPTAASRFATRSLPLTLGTNEPAGAPLTAQEAADLLFAPAVKLGGAEFSSLLELWHDAATRKATRALLTGDGVDGERYEARAVGQVVVAGRTWRLVRLRQEMHTWSSSGTYAFALGSDGAPEGGGQLQGGNFFGAGAGSTVVTLRADGRFTDVGTSTEPVMDVPGLLQLDRRTTSEGALDAKGVITHSPAVPFGVPAGRWQDPKSNEQLILAPQEDGGVQVFYAAKPGQPWQELKVDPAPTREKLTVSFKVKQPKPYVLSVTAEQKIRCRNPDGSVQTFVGGE